MSAAIPGDFHHPFCFFGPLLVNWRSVQRKCDHGIDSISGPRRRNPVLRGGFSGKVLRGGLHIVPEAALEALTSQSISYSIATQADPKQKTFPEY
jgi:hypothetical protein